MLRFEKVPLIKSFVKLLNIGPIVFLTREIIHATLPQRGVLDILVNNSAQRIEPEIDRINTGQHLLRQSLKNRAEPGFGIGHGDVSKSDVAHGLARVRRFSRLHLHGNQVTDGYERQNENAGFHFAEWLITLR